MLITDKVTLGDVRVGADGYLEAFARTARTGVQSYLGREAGRPDLATVAVYRDEAAVFSKTSLDSFSKIPVTLDHPAEAVTSKNWRLHAVGTTGDEVLRDGEHLKIGLKIKDQAAIDAVQAGKRELSVGYTTELVWGDGVTPDGTPYQAKQTAIVANHIAIVSAGRAGPQCRIGDSWAAFSTEQKDAPIMTLKTVTVDGIPVEVTDQGATVINTLLGRLADGKTAHDKLLSDHAAAISAKDTQHASSIAAKDEEIGTLKADLQNAKDATPKPEQLDKLVADRAALVTIAKAIDGKVVVDGKSDAEIRRAAVAAKLGDEFVKDASDAEIIGMFKAIAKDVKPGIAIDQVRDAIRSGTVTVGDAKSEADKARAKRDDDLRNGWKGKAAA